MKKRSKIWCASLISILMLHGTAASPYVSPLTDESDGRIVWGLRDGIRIGLYPNPGPAGLIRIYTPFLDQTYPRVVNFLSIEPLVKKDRERGQSELETSRDRPGSQGLTFWATNSLTERARLDEPASGYVHPETGRLHVFIHTEAFANGALPIIECIFDPSTKHELELRTHTATGSAPLQQCVISATMGNYGLLRKIHLADGEVLHVRDLWSENEPLDTLGFLPWRSIPAERLTRLEDGRCHVEMSSDDDNPAGVNYEEGTKSGWRYEGKKALHYWRSEPGPDLAVGINARRTFWKTESKIPGGPSFENFELNRPFQPGQSLWFGIKPDTE